MLSVARAERLLDMLQQDRSLTVTAAAEYLGVSPSTIRRDLTHLESQGRLSRVYGGAVIEASAEDPIEPPRLARKSEHADAKRQIGQAAARLVTDNDTILVAGGTTTDAMLQFLGGRTRLTVLTNNLQTAVIVSQHPEITVVVLGGYLRRDELSLLGHLGVEALSRLNVDRAFYGAYAVDADGLMGAEFNETETDRALISAAPELVVLADSSKFSRRAPARLASATEISTLVTDAAAPVATLDALSAQGVRIITC
ncbi:MAG TPA: DeoR/GlpR family DNA-binding transcription regulator [Streptosporangiaceae bacterium]|nr:DeoR/GlpR family DNA-binding transcription regulator [Streptosporangiaceae bacterium]